MARAVSVEYSRTQLSDEVTHRIAARTVSGRDHETMTHVQRDTHVTKQRMAMRSNFPWSDFKKLRTPELSSSSSTSTALSPKNFLMLNPGKTELIVFGSKQVLSELEINGVFISSSICIRLVCEAKNLGFTLDSSLSLNSQIKKLKAANCNKLRNISKMKPFLSPSQLETITQSLVISSLDYCNSLNYGANSTVLKQLQLIQNRACRIIKGLKRRDGIEPYLQELHWLKIQERIEFKILLLTFKAIHGLAPPY